MVVVFIFSLLKTASVTDKSLSLAFSSTYFLAVMLIPSQEGSILTIAVSPQQ